jgi:hypothetical protein
MTYDAPAKYKGTGSYGVLTDAEKTSFDEYTNLRGISDWPGYDAAQDQRRADARTWVLGRMDYIADLAGGLVEGQTAGWDTASRGKRYDYLSTLNGGSPKHEVRLPCSGTATNAEKSYIEEREVYLAWGSAYEAQKARKQANVDWLVEQRKKLWHLMKDDASKNKANDRQTRYDNLCIATHHGSAYEDWAATHNKWGQPYTPEKPSSKSGRAKCKDWLDSYVGTSENPKGSNKGSPQPSQWQQRVYGSDGVPWCACFAGCAAWDNGVSGSVTAGVWNNTELAKKGQGIYKGYTTDPSKVHAGDHAFKGSDHTGVIYDRDTMTTVEGNTSGSTSSGSQWNGDLVAKKTRGGGYWTGYGLVRFPDD